MLLIGFEWSKLLDEDATNLSNSVRDLSHHFVERCQRGMGVADQHPKPPSKEFPVRQRV
jgi:hypothetical protein